MIKTEEERERVCVRLREARRERLVKKRDRSDASKVCQTNLVSTDTRMAELES